VVDADLAAAKIATIRDAVSRISAVLPIRAEEFLADRTCREVVTLNLFVAIQEGVALASHLLADAGWGVPRTYGECFTSLADHGVLTSRLASHLRAAAGLRNVLAHQYGAVDFTRVHGYAGSRTSDLLEFCSAVAAYLKRTP
jgi:uncharacterized protein YutE (UPF0331/DUF86 family)